MECVHHELLISQDCVFGMAAAAAALVVVVVVRARSVH